MRSTTSFQACSAYLPIGVLDISLDVVQSGAVSDDRRGAGSWSGVTPLLTAVLLRGLWLTLTVVFVVKNFDGPARVLLSSLAVGVVAFLVWRDLRRGESRDVDA